MSPRDLVIEALGKALEVDVGRVHVAVQLDARFGTDVAGGHRDRLDAAFAAGVGDVDRVFQKDRRVVVGEGDAAAAELLGGFGDGFGRGGVGERVDLARFRNIPVL